ncbi:MAG: DNA primase [Magnetospiraceae bacterium]
MPLPPNFLDELKARVTVSDIVGRRVKLVRKGREFSGLCPFHKEKTPSFTVNDEKGFYHCFGCGEHGTALDFVMATEGLGFREAVERLAATAGMEVPQDTPEERARSKKRQSLQEVMETAASWYARQLYDPQGAAALAYLRDRGLSEATIARFRLGFAPAGRNALKLAMEKAGVTEDQLVAAGLAIRPDDASRAPYDRFRGRVMFPITDRTGKVIAFGGRVLDGGEPKYLNSPETELFHKGNVLYGLGQARSAIAKAGSVIVVEGYMDVIALAQAGIEHAVAPLGTALTDDQIAELWRLAPNPVLCFDGDAAGQRAAARAADRALPSLKPGRGLRFAILPPGEDPDSLVRHQGRSAFDRCLEEAIPLSELVWQMEAHQTADDSPEERAALLDRLKKHAFKIEHEEVRSFYLSGFRDRVWQQKRGPRGARPTAPVGSTANRFHRTDTRDVTEKLLLAAVIHHPEIFDTVSERLGVLRMKDAQADALRQEVLRTMSIDPDMDRDSLISRLASGAHRRAFEAVAGRSLLTHGRFARPETMTPEVLSGWEEVFSETLTAEVQREIEDQEAKLAENLSDETFERLRRLTDYLGQISPFTNLDRQARRIGS